MAKKNPPPTGRAARLRAYHPVLDRLIFIVALLGLLVTVHLKIQQDRGFDRGCLGFTTSEAVEGSFDCNLVVQSDAGEIFGVSNAVAGMLFYLLVGGFTFALLFASEDARVRMKQLRALLVAGGFAYSLYLVYYQAAVIGEFCLLCTISAGLVLVLFIALLVEWFGKGEALTTAKKRTKEAGVMAGMLVLVLVLVGADLAYFSGLAETAPTPAAQPAAQPVAGATPGAEAAPADAECGFKPDYPAYRNYRDLVTFSDPVKGNADADVVVIEYFEPNCPHCKTLYPVMEEVIAEYGDRAAFYVQPIVFWEDRSMTQAAALLAASQEGKYFEMLEAQFARQNPQTGLHLDALRQIAGEIGMDANVMERRLRSGVYQRLVQRQSEKVTKELNVREVPTVLINGRNVANKTKECLSQLIEAAG